MKYFVIVVCITLSVNLLGQKVYQSQNDIFTIPELVFYGYDFSHFKLAEGKRINEDILPYINSWIGYMDKEMNAERLTRKLKKEKVILDYDYTLSVIKNTDDKEFVSPVKHFISPDSIQSIINGYRINEKEGVGMVVIVECFEKSTETSYAYFVFFDIATKNVLMSNHFIDKKGKTKGWGMVNFWGDRLYTLFDKYIKKVYLKAQTK